MKAVKPKFNVHQAVTDRLLEAMQASDGQVNMPWHHDGQKMPVNVVSGNKYRGANIVLLWMSSVVGGYTSNQWATCNQWKKLGGIFREGEVSTTIMFYKKIKFVDPDTEESESLVDDAESDVRTRMFARAYRVYNRCQIDGLGDDSELQVSDPVNTIYGAEAFVQGTGADIRVGGGSASYSPSKDVIRMPDQSLFTGTKTSNATESWYSTLLHELSHWTGAKHRLNRDGIAKRFADKGAAISVRPTNAGVSMTSWPGLHSGYYFVATRL